MEVGLIRKLKNSNLEACQLCGLGQPRGFLDLSPTG